MRRDGLVENWNEMTAKIILARWFALELASTIFGSKPSTVLSIVDTRHQPTLTLWRQWGSELFDGSAVRYFVLKEAPERLTILFYRPDMLDECIQETNNRKFLEQHGYPVNLGSQACLEFLKERFANTCPHEMGILLGIPLKDVLGFMGLSDQPLCCRGCWCVYGNPECSLAIMKQFDIEKQRVAGWLEQGQSPLQVLAYQQSA